MRLVLSNADAAADECDGWIWTPKYPWLYVISTFILNNLNINLCSITSSLPSIAINSRVIVKHLIYPSSPYSPLHRHKLTSRLLSRNHHYSSLPSSHHTTPKVPPNANLFLIPRSFIHVKRRTLFHRVHTSQASTDPFTRLFIHPLACPLPPEYC